jgi:NitT/TauT family transport system permease protein
VIFVTHDLDEAIYLATASACCRILADRHELRSICRARGTSSTREHPESCGCGGNCSISSRRPSSDERSAKLCAATGGAAGFEVWARATHLQSDSLVPPSEIARRCRRLRRSLDPGATRDTLFSTFTGLAIGTIIGLALGIAFGIFDTLDRLMEVTVEAIRPIPSIALLPIALIALGFGYRMEIVIVAFACVWPILILSRAAVRSIEPRLMEVARALRLPPAQRVWKIIIPAALPRIFVAFRLSAGIALIVAVTVEIAINPLGLGAGIMLAQQALRPDLMLAYLIWIGIIGYALNILLTVAQQRLFGRAALSGDGQ